jgi:PhzF family phenazine biosynthesis protein
MLITGSLSSEPVGRSTARNYLARSITMMVSIYQVDAFTDKPFSGNPAAVCILEEPRDETWMLNVAREMNLSETAFLHKQEDGYRLRWFTPVTEIELCGHATLASAHILWETGLLDPQEPAYFHTLSGLLTATKKGDEIEMDFPAISYEPLGDSGDLTEALGVSPTYQGKSDFFILMEVGSEREVRDLRPDFEKVKSLSADAVIVTSEAATPGLDFISRCFAPNVGIDEDPVTGSAHCFLGPYWSKRFGKDELAAYQASERGGKLRVRVQGERVFLVGHAVTVLRGQFISS